MSQYKTWRYTIHYVKPTAQLLFKNRFPKGGPTCKRQVVNPRHKKAARTISRIAWNSPAEYPSWVARCDTKGSDRRSSRDKKHPGRWGIVDHQILCIKVLFKTNIRLLYIRWVHVRVCSICNVGSCVSSFRASSRYWCHTENYDIQVASISWKKIKTHVCVCMRTCAIKCNYASNLIQCCTNTDNWKIVPILILLLTNNGCQCLLKKSPPPPPPQQMICSIKLEMCFTEMSAIVALMNWMPANKPCQK